MSSPTPTATMTPTPTTTPIICGSGVTTGSYYYTDCCGNIQMGTAAGVTVILNYTYPFNGITKLNLVATQSCPTPTPTPTSSQTPTPSVTTTHTPTPSVTQTQTPSATPCKPQTIPLDTVNECQVFTLFDMGIQCSVISQPSSANATDGILSIIVTGGTSPYTFLWDGGQRNQTLYNLLPGFYPVTVVDYYGDYTASTVCQLVAPTPTPSPTPTFTPTPTSTACTDLCLISVNQVVEYGPWQFICGPFVNGRQSWNYTSGATVYNIIYQPQNLRWVVVGSDLTTPVIFTPGIMTKKSDSLIPLGPWVYAGGTGSNLPINVTQGVCPTSIPLNAIVSTQNTSCSGVLNCNGSIIFTTFGGNPPYEYSINNGLSYQSSNIFNALCSGTYTTVVRDSNLSAFTQTVVISSNQNYVSYNVGVQNDGQLINVPNPSLSTQTGDFSIQVAPNLPVGTTINLTLVINFEIQNKGPWFNDNPDQTATYTFTSGNISVLKNNVNVPLTVSPVNNVISQRPLCNAQIRTTTGSFTANLSLTSGDVISGEFACQLQMSQPVSDGSCVSTITSNIQVSTSNVTISGCNCCGVVNIPTPAVYEQTLVGSLNPGG